MKKLIFTYSSKVSFVRNDIELLKDHFQIKELRFGSSKGIYLLYNLIRSVIYLSIYNIQGYRTNYIWFADYHAFLPTLISKLFGGKTHVVVGGYDVVNDEKLNYGGHVKKYRSYIIQKVFHMADTLIAVSDHLSKELTKNFSIDKSKVKVVYNACELQENNFSNKEDLIICVSIANTENRVLIKGIDKYIELANNLPFYKFVLVGISSKLNLKSKFSIPENLEIIGKLPYSELVEFYKRAKIICQFSRYESFGLAVLEGISYDCLPLVSNTGGLPELVNSDENFMIDIENHSETKKKANYLLDNYFMMKNDLLKKDLTNKYGFENRRKSLLKILGLKSNERIL